MIRKPMEDVIIHHADTANVVPVTYKTSYEKAPSIFSKQERDEDDRIEKNPFFEKVRPARGFNLEEEPKSRTMLWVIAVLTLLGAAFFIINYFSSATVEITPLVYRGHLDHDFSAAKEVNAASAGGESLPFHFVSLTDEKSEEVPATIEQKIQKKAFGKVVIYNAYSKDVQRLIKNTRIESADHKIFRIDQSVVVPGAKVVAGKVSQPGIVEVLAYADVPGAEYNIGLGDFTIPGFKGDPRYTKFSARSKPDSPIAGGYSGTVKVPADEDVKKAQEDIKQGLKVTAIEKARALIPEGMSFFPGSTVLKFEETPQDFAARDTAKVTVKATVSVFFFDTVVLTQKLAESAIADYKTTPLVLSNMSSLSFTFVDRVDNIILADLTQVRFHIVGDPLFVGQIDSKNIQTSLVGKEKKDFGKIIVGKRNIEKAETTVRPMWKTTFPTDPAKITIKILEADK